MGRNPVGVRNPPSGPAIRRTLAHPGRARASKTFLFCLTGYASSLGFDAHWTIITYTGTLTDNGLDLGVMPSLPEGWGWEVDTTSQPGEVWLVVPEPSAALLGLLGVLGLLRRRRA